MSWTPKTYRSLFQTLRTYWSLYGGHRALIASPYLHFSIFLALICWGIWSNEGWWSLPLDFLPNAMGFSLAAMAMLLAFGNEGFMNLLATRAQPQVPSLFEKASSAFFHFLLIQFIAYVAALFCSALPDSQSQFAAVVREWTTQHYILGRTVQALRLIIWGLVFLLFVYSISCGLAAVVRIFQLTVRFCQFVEAERRRPPTRRRRLRWININRPR